MRRFILAVFLSAFIFLPGSVGECYVTLSYKDVPLSFAKLRLPSELYVVEIDYASLITKLEKEDYFVKTLETEKNEEQKKKYLQAIKYLFSDEAKKFMDTIKVYQVGLFADNSYNNAFIVSVKNNSTFKGFNKKFIETKSLAQSKDALLAAKEAFEKTFMTVFTDKGFWLTDGIKMFSGAKDEILFLQWGNFDTKELNKRQIYSTSMRMSGVFGDTLSSSYFKLYCSYDKKNTEALVLVTLDNERELWSKIFDDAILNSGQIK